MTVNSEVNLVCISLGTEPDTQVVWYRNDSREPIDRSYRIQVKNYALMSANPSCTGEIIRPGECIVHMNICVCNYMELSHFEYVFEFVFPFPELNSFVKQRSRAFTVIIHTHSIMMAETLVPSP